jgi:hypothetical protein
MGSCREFLWQGTVTAYGDLAPGTVGAVLSCNELRLKEREKRAGGDFWLLDSLKDDAASGKFAAEAFCAGCAGHGCLSQMCCFIVSIFGLLRMVSEETNLSLVCV